MAKSSFPPVARDRSGSRKSWGALYRGRPDTDGIKAVWKRWDTRHDVADNGRRTLPRVCLFCSGCPHNSSQAQKGSRAYAGDRLHYMCNDGPRDDGLYPYGAKGD